MSQIPLFSLGRSLAICQLKNGFTSLSTTSRLLSTAAATKPKTDKPARSPPKETNSLVMNMFNGSIRTDLVFPYPDVLNDEQHEILEMIKEPQYKLYEKFDPLLAEEKEAYEEEHMEAVKAMGGYGIMVPAEYGGAALNNTQYARLGEIMGSKDLAIGIVLGAHQSIGYKGIVLFGTDEQKEKYLPDLAAGKRLAAFCLTEPSAGSDASSIQCRAVLSPDGSHYVLNGSKCWISNGGTADVFTVFARTHVKTETGELKDKVSAFIVERAFGGVTSGPPEKKMGIKASNTTEVFFDNVKIPKENLLGQEGEGFKVAMNILNSGRFGMGAALTGSMKTCIETAVHHAKTRKQFGDYICNFGTIQEKIARMAMAHYTTESLAYLISGIMDRGFTEFQLEAAVGKIVASESAWFVSDEALQILGGMGYVKSPGIEKFMRDIRIFRIFEGTNEILRLFIALTGLQAAGYHLKELQRAISKPMDNIGLLFDEGTKRVLKSVGISGNNPLSGHVAPELQLFANLATKGVMSFSNSVEYLLRRYNKDIIHEQFLLQRLANSAIDIFVMMTVLSRASRSVNKNLASAQLEVHLASVICSEAADRIENNLGYLRSSSSLKNVKTMKAIASEIFTADGVAHKHPIDRV